jgi:hypothetical protein
VIPGEWRRNTRREEGGRRGTAEGPSQARCRDRDAVGWQGGTAWPELSPPRGLSVATGKTVINAVNAFIISRRFQDEVAEKRRVDDLENAPVVPVNVRFPI